METKQKKFKKINFAKNNNLHLLLKQEKEESLIDAIKHHSFHQVLVVLIEVIYYKSIKHYHFQKEKFHHYVHTNAQ